MKVIFSYEKKKDVWCLLNKGRSSNNSQSPTSQYSQLVSLFGEDPTEQQVDKFVELYIKENEIDVNKVVSDFGKEWVSVADEFHKRAKKIFGVDLPSDVNAFLTVNSRCPYNIEENYFYVSLTSEKVLLTVMHELWHFYTWYGLGAKQEQKLGKEKYNDLKEALTVLLNIECIDLLPEGVTDEGYPQHLGIRNEVVEYWKEERDIRKLWNHLI